MAYKYYYIDDMPDKVQGMVVGLNKKDIIEVEYFEPKGNWEEEIFELQTARSRNQYQGLILDLRLQDEPNKEQKTSRYRGSSLAQEIRIRVKEGSFADCPIILLSATDNLAASMDKTSNDLFDYIIEKESLGDTLPYNEAHDILTALATGYERLLKKPNFEDLLETDLSFIDRRLVNQLSQLYSSKPIHILASFIIKQMLEKFGPLIDFRVLMARLGVDYEKSEGVEILVEQMKPFIYTGPFYEGWERWWFPLVEKWWIENFPDKILRLLNAQQRIELLNEKLHLGLIAATKTSKSRSDKFWVICKGTLKPIDQTDGFIIAHQDNLYPWQEKEYISIDEALSRKNLNKWKGLASLEKSRYENLLKSFESNGEN